MWSILRLYSRGNGSKAELTEHPALQEHQIGILIPEGDTAAGSLHHAGQHAAAADGAPQQRRPRHAGAPAAGPPGGLHR